MIAPVRRQGVKPSGVTPASAATSSPQILLLDEPFAALDALTRIRMHALLRRLAEIHSPAVLLVTHDVDEAIALADRVVVLEGGRLVADLGAPRRPPAPIASPETAAFKSRLLALLGV